MLVISLVRKIYGFTNPIAIEFGFWGSYILSSLDIDVDDGVTEPGVPVYANLTSSPINFRYGRLLLDNAFGPETEDLEIPVRVQYFDGREFLLNTDDSCTTLTFSVSIPPLTIVDDSVIAQAGTENPLGAGDKLIEEGVT